MSQAAAWGAVLPEGCAAHESCAGFRSQASSGGAEAPPAEGVLRMCQLCVGYPGRCLLHGLDGSLRPGQFLAVMGPSGTGKTSLLRCLAGLLEPVAGRVEYWSEAAGRALPPREFRRKMGLIFQHLRLTPNASVETNVLCGVLGQLPWWRTLWGFPRELRVRVRGLLADLDLVGYERIPVARISGGERQRVAIARALLGRPAVLLADEPVSHLDRRLARRVLGVVRERARTEGMAVVCVLHDEELAREFADRIWDVRFAWEGGFGAPEPRRQAAAA